jgi:PmbA protein
MTDSSLARAASPDELSGIVERALGEARRGGASQAEAGVSTDTGLSVTVRFGEVETLEYQRDRGMGITVYVGGRKGSASTADLSWQAVAETVEKALSIARFTAEDPFAGLADAGRGARLRPADPQLRRGLGKHPFWAACLRQYPWLPWRLSFHRA